MLKVIGGKYRSRVLLTPDEDTVPTKARVREGIANALSSIAYDAEVLDLFAGSGALGIEMLSRGAKHCHFVDHEAKALDIVRKNLFSLKESNATCLLLDYRAALERLAGENQRFDIILLDPPYAMRESYREILNIVESKGLWKEGGALMMEYEGDCPIENMDSYARAKTYNYGRTKVLILWR